MSTLAENVLAAGAKNKPPMLQKNCYDTWQSRMLVYSEGKEHGEMLLDSILSGPFELNEITILANKANGSQQNHAYDIWYRVKELMEGTKLTKQERESKLADEFDRFTSHKRETIQSYYMRCAKLMNDINIIGLDMTRLQVNTNFVNHLQREWSRFVIGVKQARNLHEVSFDQLYAYLKQNEPDENEVRVMKVRFPYPLALVANTHNLPPSYSSYKS
ncbi:hypothetical protein Tco_0818172 [Tanacetum coccineum]